MKAMLLTWRLIHEFKDSGSSHIRINLDAHTDFIISHTKGRNAIVKLQCVEDCMILVYKT